MAIHHRASARTFPSLRHLRHCLSLGLALAAVSACSTSDGGAIGLPGGSSPTLGGGAGGALHDNGGSNMDGAVSGGAGGSTAQGGQTAAGSGGNAGSAG